MSRLYRKNRTAIDIGFKNSGGLNDLFDNQFKLFLRVNDEEMDYICDFASDEELNLLTKFEINYAEKKEIIKTINKLLKSYNESLNKAS